MTRNKLIAALLAGSAAASAAPASVDANAEMSALRAEVEALQARLALVEAAKPPQAQPEQPAEISFAGAPEISAPGGWSFKPIGRLQYDAGRVSRPEGIADPGLGFSNELRRARIGVEGDMPGGFGYKFEIDFAGEDVEITDAILTWDASDALVLTLGQHNNFQSLEELTSSRFSSFIERAAFTDAFNFERRVGLSASFKAGPLLVQAGLFTDNIADLGEDANDSYGVDGRIVVAPKIGDTQFHLGASAHKRDLGDLPRTGVTSRYRQRPLIHSTDLRFIGTPALSVESEAHYGVEAALVRGPFHAAAEAHWFEASRIEPASSPSLFGAYVEAGYFLTGESRGYRGGRFDRTRPARAVEEGGIGAVQVNLRYDRLDLNSGPVRGGKQDGLMASLVWIPTDHLRFLINYARLSYDDAVIPAAGGDRSYGVDVIGARAQIDF